MTLCIGNDNVNCVKEESTHFSVFWSVQAESASVVP